MFYTDYSIIIANVQRERQFYIDGLCYKGIPADTSIAAMGSLLLRNLRRTRR